MMTTMKVFSRKVPQFLLVLLAGLVLAVTGCDTTDADGDGGNNTTTDGGTNTNNDGGPEPDSAKPPEGVVSLKKAGEEVEVNFESGDEMFLVVPYSVASAAAEAISFTIETSGDGASSNSSALIQWKQPREPLQVRNPALWARWQKRIAGEKWLRQVAVNAAKSPLKKRPALNRPLAACTKSSECEAEQVCSAGECATSVTINVGEFSSGTIDAAVKRKGDKVAILVGSDETVEDGDLDKLLETTEKTIVPRDLALFGAPPLKAGEDQPAYDRNGDGLIWIVVTGKLADKGFAGGFVATDFTDKPNSNKADILYVEPPSAETTVDKLYPTVAHELQHLLSFAVKAYPDIAGGKEGKLEDLWLDEGMAHLAEDACGFGAEIVTLLDEELFATFSDVSLFATEDSKAMRAMAFTYVRYLFEQKGGVGYGSDPALTEEGGGALLQAIHKSTKRGAAVIDEVYGTDHKAAFGNWITAIALDGRGVSDYPGWNFAPLVDDSVTGNKIGVVVRGKRVDGTGAEVELQGPLEEELTEDSTEETVAASSGKFFLLKGKKGAVKVTVKTPDSDFHFAVIKLK